MVTDSDADMVPLTRQQRELLLQIVRGRLSSSNLLKRGDQIDLQDIERKLERT